MIKSALKDVAIFVAQKIFERFPPNVPKPRGIAEHLRENGLGDEADEFLWNERNFKYSDTKSNTVVDEAIKKARTDVQDQI